MKEGMGRKIFVVIGLVAILALAAGSALSLSYGYQHLLVLILGIGVGIVVAGYLFIGLMSSSYLRSSTISIIAILVFAVVLFVISTYHEAGDYNYALIVRQGDKVSITKEAFVFPGTISGIDSIGDMNFEFSATIETEHFLARWTYQIDFWYTGDSDEILLILKQFGSMAELARESKRIFETEAKAALLNITAKNFASNSLDASDLDFKLLPENQVWFEALRFDTRGVVRAKNLRQVFIIPKPVANK